MNRIYLILNPAAGHGNGRRVIPALRQHLADLDIDYTLQETEGRGHAVRLAETAVREGASAVVAAGGDGTVNEVLNGLMQAGEVFRPATLGILPVGRGNDTAFAAGIPADLTGACRTLAAGQKRPFDVGMIQGKGAENGRYFGNSVGIGFDTVVSIEAMKMKRLKGFVSYVAAALKTITLFYRAPQVKVQMDGQTINTAALMVSVMNGRRQGGIFMMAPDAQTDDGRLDITIAGQVSRAQMLRLIVRFIKGNQAGHPAIHTDQSEAVMVTAVTGRLPTHADGEILCEDGREYTLSVLPWAVEIIGGSPDQ